MRKKQKYQLISPSLSFKNNQIRLNQNYKYVYHSKSFFIKFYGYLPLVHSLRLADFSKQFTILDLGCADGPFLPTLNYYSKKIVGIDLDKDSLILANKLINDHNFKLKKVGLLNSDGLYLPFKDRTFDLIFCLEVLEHVENSLQAINEISRILKKKGVLICSLPIEIGISLLIRTILGKTLKFKRPHYKFKEIIKSVFLKKPENREKHMDHKNFDWRLIYREIKRCFKNYKLYFTPINFLKNINPIVIIVANK